MEIPNAVIETSHSWVMQSREPDPVGRSLSCRREGKRLFAKTRAEALPLPAFSPEERLFPVALCGRFLQNRAPGARVY